jgi:hypothetical protein
MSIELYWDNDEQTILLCEFHPGWTWDEMYKTLETVKKITDRTSYEIAAIIDVHEGVGIPGGNLLSRSNFDHAKRMLSMGEGGTGPIVIVGANPMIKAAHDAFRMVDRKATSNIAFAKTLDEARVILARVHVPASPLAQQVRATA